MALIDQGSNRRGNVARLVCIVLPLVLVVACLGVFLLRGSAAPPDEGRGIAEAFLAQIRDGDADSAWEGTTAEFKSFMGRDRFRRFVETHPALMDAAEFTGFQMTSPQGLPLAECTFRSQSGSESATIKVLLAREEGEWKVERVSVE
jgi:hypothetical protein